jgi:hypothetical protein
MSECSIAIDNIAVRGCDPFSSPQQQSLTEVVQALDQMLILLQIRDELVEFFDQYYPILNRVNVRIAQVRTADTNNPTEDAVRRAEAIINRRPALVIQASDEAANEAIAAMFPEFANQTDSPFDLYMQRIGSRLHSLQPYANQAYEGHGIANALRSILNEYIPQQGSAIRQRLTEATFVPQVMQSCHPGVQSFDDTGIMQLNTDNVRQIREAYADLQVDCDIPPPPPPCELDLSPEARRAMSEADRERMYGPGGPLDGPTRLDRWAQRWGVDFFTDLRLGGAYRQIETRVIDLLGDRSSDADIGLSGGIQRDQRVGSSPYHFTYGVRADGDYFGDMGMAGRPHLGRVRGGLILYGYDASQGRLPNFGLSALYNRVFTSGVPNQPNPAGGHFQLRLNVSEQITRIFGLEGGFDFAVGSYNESLAAGQQEVNHHDWQQMVWRGGFNLSLGPTRTSAGYEGRAEGREQVQLSGAEGPLVQVFGHGGYFTFLLEAGRHTFELAANIVTLSATDVSTLGFDGLRGGASARYRLTRPGGRRFDLDIRASYQRENLITANGTSDTVILTPGFTNIPLWGGTDGGYGVYMDVEPYAAYRRLNFEEGYGLPTLSQGAEAGLMLTVGLRAGDRETRLLINEIDERASAPGRGMREVQLQTESLPLSEGEMFDDPLIIAATESAPGRINMRAVNGLLLAWRSGLLEDDYSFDPSRLPEDLERAIQRSDGLPGQAGRYGYAPEQGETVSIGSVDPMPFRIGAYVQSHRGGNPTAMNAEQLEEYQRGYNVISPRERAVLRAYVARREMRAQGVEVALPTTGDWLTRRVMNSAERIVLNNADSRDLETFITTFAREHNTEISQVSQGLDIENFAQQLRAELLEARVVGPAVMALARWKLLGVSGLEPDYRQAIMELTSLDSRGVEILRVLSMGRNVPDADRITAEDIVNWLDNIGNPECEEQTTTRGQGEVEETEEEIDVDGGYSEEEFEDVDFSNPEDIEIEDQTETEADTETLEDQD